MNDRRRSRLKQLATGLALVSTTALAQSGEPTAAPQDIHVNSPPRTPKYVNSPSPQRPEPKPQPDAGVAPEPEPRPEPPHVNSPKPAPKRTK